MVMKSFVLRALFKISSSGPLADPANVTSCEVTYQISTSGDPSDPTSSPAVVPILYQPFSSSSSVYPPLNPVLCAGVLSTVKIPGSLKNV